MNSRLNKKRALEEIQKRFKKAEALLKDDVRMESFLEKIEKKIKWIPFLAQEFKNIPTMVSMVRSYLRGNYTKIPKRTILAIVSALIYFLSPHWCCSGLDSIIRTTWWCHCHCKLLEFGQQGCWRLSTVEERVHIKGQGSKLVFIPSKSVGPMEGFEKVLVSRIT